MKVVMPVSTRLMSRSYALVCVLLMLVATATFAGEVGSGTSASMLPVAADGYPGTRWGMSRNEVKDAFPEIKKKKWNRGSRPVMPNVIRGKKKAISHKFFFHGVKCLRIFSFDENDELNEVIIHPLSGYGSPTGKNQLNDMLKLWPLGSGELSSHYGSPLFAQGNLNGGTSENLFEDLLYGGRYVQRRWITPTSTITLQIQRNSLISTTECLSVCEDCSTKCERHDRFHPFLIYKKR